MYLYYGLEQFLINKEIDKIKKDNDIEDIDIVRYDLENTKLETIIEDALSISLFSNKKLIIVDNAYIFTGTTNKKLIEQNIDILKDYINNGEYTNIIIFNILKEKLDERKNIVKLIKEKGVVKDFNLFNNINKYILDMFDNYKISNNNINLLINRVGSNLEILSREIEKIKIYKDNDLEIKEEDIINLTTKNVDTDFFNLIENIVSKNKEKALESYFEIIKYGEEPIKIIVVLANKFRLIYQAKNLYKKGYSEKDISSLLGNQLNNELDNLEVRLLGEHQKEHHPQKYADKMATCEWCGKEFLWTAKQQRTFYINQNRKSRENKKHENPFCSRKCRGEYGAYIQANMRE